MTSSGEFPSRVLRLSQLEALGGEGSVDPARINQHIEGSAEPTRVMTEEEVASLLGDPYAMLILRRGTFPATLTEMIAALDAFDAEPDGLPDKSSFLISEGGQIPFHAGLDKGGSRLILVRGRGGAAELMISVLLQSGADPRGTSVLLEVQSWDPTNQTMHFYQRQKGAWFWCGQSDMALVAPTRGEGAWDSHVNGYPLMKELKTPWVHWHGPSLGISETAFASDDPLVTDEQFTGKTHALTFEQSVMRPLSRRWNEARFAKASSDGVLVDFDRYVRQFAGSTTANLISTHKEWSTIEDGGDLGDIPVTFFVDTDALLGVLGLAASVPTLAMDGATYKGLVEKFDLRVRGEGVDMPGDVPFCFTVPERALEDTLALEKLVQTATVSRRLAAAILTVDFTNPLFSASRTGLQHLFPDSVAVGGAEDLDRIVIAAAEADPRASDPSSPVGRLLATWNLGPTEWEAAISAQVTGFLATVVTLLASAVGCEDIFRLAESRRREFRLRPLAEFGLSLPQAVAIAETEPFLEMLPDGSVIAKTSSEA